MSRLVDGQLDCTADYNDLMLLLLGIRKYFDEIALLVETNTPNFAADAKRGTTEDADQEVIFALLGFFSLRQRLDRWLNQCTTAASSFEPMHYEASKLEINLLR
jgi:hypothetical protein